MFQGFVRFSLVRAERLEYLLLNGTKIDGHANISPNPKCLTVSPPHTDAYSCGDTNKVVTVIDTTQFQVLGDGKEMVGCIYGVDATAT